MTFTEIFEAPEAEVARLAEAPVGSEMHTLSTLPVNIRGWIEDLVIELPREANDGYTIVVVPFDRMKDTERPGPMPYRRHRGWWRVLIVASNHPSYPVGGHRLAISETQLVRGTLRPIEIPAAPAVAAVAA